MLLPVLKRGNRKFCNVLFPGLIPSKISKVQCTMVNKGVIIEILDFELGAFSENLKHITTWSKGIFGFYLQKKKF